LAFQLRLILLGHTFVVNNSVNKKFTFRTGTRKLVLKFHGLATWRLLLATPHFES
jgi:hypothetical protein